MEKKKILWLCSWYPSKVDPFNGDFIQRHARAAALFNDIHVIHVTEDMQGEADAFPDTLTQENNLAEHIIYFKRRKTLASKLTDKVRWLSVYKRAIRNYIVKNGKPDLVHVHVPMKAGILGLWIKKNYKVPYLVTEHWGIYNDIIENGYSSKSYAFKQVTRRIFQKASAFISVSRYLAEGVKELVGNKAYQLVPNVVNTDLFCFAEKEKSRFRFIHVSNMVALKNPRGILRSFERFLQQQPDAELVMAGDKDLNIRNYANSLNIPITNLSFTGEIPYEQVAIEMKRADCLILFSTIENSPCVIGEALCCGLPVITSDAGGIPELVDTSNAIVIKPGDEAALTESMIKMFKNTSDFDRKKIAETAQRRFSYPVIGGAINSIYSAVLTTAATNKLSL